MSKPDAVFDVEEFAVFTSEFVYLFLKTVRRVEQFADFSMLKSRNDPTVFSCLRGV